jgi:hypothetical protein
LVSKHAVTLPAKPSQRVVYSQNPSTYSRQAWVSVWGHDTGPLPPVVAFELALSPLLPPVPAPEVPAAVVPTAVEAPANPDAVPPEPVVSPPEAAVEFETFEATVPAFLSEDPQARHRPNTASESETPFEIWRIELPG